MSKPLYRSLADSFQLQIYMPKGTLTPAPAATCEADALLSERMASDRPPQAVLMNTDESLNVYAGGSVVGTLAGCMRLICGRAVPIVRFETARAGQAIAEYAQQNCLGDLTLCVPYEMRSILQSVRSLLPLSRGMLDVRGCALPAFAELIGQIHESDATMLLGKGIDRAFARRLQKRFVQVWLEAEADVTDALAAGVCGVLTQRTGELYDLISLFPEGATVRPAPLYAHKAYHATGEYPENSTSACEAAGRLGYDATEIDVQLTSDDVLVVHHDRHTGNLFNGELTVSEEPWARLSALRRKQFPQAGLDRMEDLMRRMTDYPETPVLIEIKTPAATNGVEECVRQLAELFRQEDTQKACTCIMGVMPPYLDYVHKMLPRLPVAHCTGGQYAPSIDPEENNRRLYQLALDTRGANAGFNPYHPLINREFSELAHIRGITVFPWTYAFEPWEQGREGITEAFLSGHDGLTSDWVGKFSHVPLDVRAELPAAWKAGEPLSLQCSALLRTGEWTALPGELEIVSPDGDVRLDEAGRVVAGPGEKRILFGCRTLLDGGRSICVFGGCQRVRFE